MHESVLQVRKQTYSLGASRSDREGEKPRDGGENRVVKNMDVNCTAGAAESWTVEACDRSDKTWAVCEKGTMERRRRRTESDGVDK